MSRKKAGKVYQVATKTDGHAVLKIFVIARHQKGAVSVAETYGYAVSKSPAGTFDVVEVDADENAAKAINAKGAKS